MLRYKCYGFNVVKKHREGKGANSWEALLYNNFNHALKIRYKLLPKDYALFPGNGFM